MEEAHRFAAEVADRVVSCFLLGISKQHFCLGVVLDRLVVAIVGIVGRHFSYSVNRPMLRIAEIEVFFFFWRGAKPSPRTKPERGSCGSWLQLANQYAWKPPPAGVILPMQ